MTLYQRPENPVGENWFFAVNKNSEKQEKACEFLNWFYTPENIVKLYEEKEGMDPYGKEEEKPVFQWLGLTQAEAGFPGKILRRRNNRRERRWKDAGQSI